MDYNCHNAAVSEFILQKVFEVTFVCMNTTTESVMPLFDRLIHNALLEFSPGLNQPLPQLDHIPEWHMVHRLLYHTPVTQSTGFRAGMLASYMSGYMNCNICKNV